MILEIEVSEENSSDDIIALTADVVAAYVSNNPVPAAELPALIGQVFASLKGVTGGEKVEAPGDGR